MDPKEYGCKSCNILAHSDSLSAVQGEIKDNLEEYNKGVFSFLMTGHECFRRITLHDSHHFSVEQQITVTIVPNLGDPSDWSALIINDCGTPTTATPPWKISSVQNSDVSFYAIKDHRFEWMDLG
ncbi:hypothetical protein M501DRAFT_988279 [Patellaria atrata CBS 101060]|uniref:Uncharacterized protein n=1 Tax=Patellaria atrata CBS 101060 TaxID=1346257 RepID=A0A9P4SGD3_9PEZI|nr:hypothetical protein M501DRAFT_988279 [Patellaria atrata CBS 101060]